MIKHHAQGIVKLLLALPLLAVISFAEQLPVTTFTTRDGLPRDSVTLIRQDSRGFIWLAGGDGLSRFDGYSFTNYTTDDGLADRRVNDLLESRSGVYWMATAAGLCRFNPTGLSKSDRRKSIAQNDALTIEPMFVVFNPTEKPIAFNALLEDSMGLIWCATSAGLYQLELLPGGGVRFHLIDFGVQDNQASNRNVTALVKDRRGTLWWSVGATLNRLLADGRVERYTQRNGLPEATIISLLEDRDGNIWAGTQRGLLGDLLRLVSSPDPSRSIVARTYGAHDGLSAGWIHKLIQTRDGKLWAATIAGLCLISPGSDSSTVRFQLYDARNGLCDSVTDLTEDRDGNLWVASGCGTHKIARHGFTGYGPADGLLQTKINSIFENRAGTLFVISAFGDFRFSGRTINKFDGTHFTASRPNLPSTVIYQGWGWGQTIIQDHKGEWWVPAFGVYRFPKVDQIEELTRSRPRQMQLVGNDSNETEVFRIFEDSRGDVWLATTALHRRLLRWERMTGIVHDHTSETGVEATTEFVSFAEDRGNNLWIGTGEGGLLRYRDGKFKRFTTDDGIPPGWIIWLYVDHAGRLWIASQLGGLNRIDDPTNESFHIVKYSTTDGLSSNNIRSITEDQWGRMYVGTGHGVDRLDVQTGSVKQFTAADGLPRGVIEVAYRDRQGALWFASINGLSRLVPAKEGSITSPSIYLTGLRIEGTTHLVSQLGVTDLPRLALSSGQRQVSVDFVGLGTTLGEELRYQYALEGANSTWSAPTTDRTINFANLGPGEYRFRVRAVDADGRASANPATFTFRIAAPIWQRAWFLALATLALGLVIYSVYRYRLRQLLELERIRIRIATDLHDDVGSGLSQVSILSEVIGRRVGHDASVAEQLSTIGSLSRNLVDSMSDIVWAINPGRDRLSDLTHRMRRLASDVFIAHEVPFVFNAPDSGGDIRLNPEMRREFYLIFKEVVNNIVSHSSCTEVKITFVISDRALDLSVYDDGVGFNPESDSEGNGLANMHQRTKKLNGKLTINSRNGNGVTINLTVPLDRRTWFGFGLRDRN